MAGTTYKWFLENYPLIFIGLIIIYVTYLVLKFYYTRFKKTEEECNKIAGLQLTANNNGVISNRIEKNIDEKLLPKIDSLVTSVNGLLLYLSQKDKDFKSEVFVVKSPVELSPIGIEILEVAGGKKYVDENLTVLLKSMEQNPLKSALDVQNQSLAALLNQVGSDQFTEIKNYLYNNPIYRKEGKDITNLNINIIAQIMGIYLRNKYFEIHPELKDVESPDQPRS